MRRDNFLIGALVALVTFIALSAFAPRRWGWHRGWRQDRCYYDGRYSRDYNYRDRDRPAHANPQRDLDTNIR